MGVKLRSFNDGFGTYSTPIKQDVVNATATKAVAEDIGEVATANDIQTDKTLETVISTDTSTGKIKIQNSSGATIIVSPNGDIIINATKALKFSTGSNISFEAGGNISFSGKNFSLNTAGAASFNIDGDMTTGVTGNKIDAVGNASMETVNGTKSSTTRGTVTQIAGAGMTTAALGGMINYVKGDMETSVDGSGTIASSGTLKMTSKGSMYVSSPSINMAASNLSVFGASGFIGGSGVNIDGNRVTAEEMKATTINADGMKATTFEGDLKGIAEFSEASSIGGTFNTVGDVDDNKTIDPVVMDEYITLGPGGVIDVNIDPNDTIKDMINLGAKTGGALDHPPTIEQIQAMLRDKSNRDNVALTNWLVENGYLSPTYRNTTPKGVKSVSGNNSSAGSYTPEKNVNQDRYTPDPQYDPNNTTGPNQLNGPGARSSTLVGEGVPLATFLKLGAKIETLSEQEKLQFARYAHIHTKEFYNKYKSDSSLSGNKLEVVMGLYTPPSKTGSVDPGGINDLAQTGRVAVYEVIDASGKQNLDATFALAVKIANKEIFDKLILDYDTYEPKDALSSPENPFFSKSKGVELEDGGIANVKIIVVLPEFGSDYIFTAGRAKNELETLLNGELQGKYLMNLQLGEMPYTGEGKAGPDFNTFPPLPSTTFLDFGPADSRVDPRIANIVNSAAATVGVKVNCGTPNSAYRSRTQNKNAGGATNSFHMYGQALDINISRMSLDQKKVFLQTMINNGAGGINVYTSDWLHVDTGSKRYWTQQPSWAREILRANGYVGP